MIPVLDGHNDALTGDGHDQLARGREDGHLDLPRMRAGGIRGAFFAVFAASEDENHEPVPRSDGVREYELAPPVAQGRAAAVATSAAGRLLALERDGHVSVARATEDLDAARDGEGPPSAILRSG